MSAPGPWLAALAPLRDAGITLDPAALDEFARSAATALATARATNDFSALGAAFATPVINQLARLDRATDQYAPYATILTTTADHPGGIAVTPVSSRVDLDGHVAVRVRVGYAAVREIGPDQPVEHWAESWDITVDLARMFTVTAARCTSCGAPTASRSGWCTYCGAQLTGAVGALCVTKITGA